ncbi:MAG: TIGR03915 family putative DNA repair protein, partial [Rubricoccaceae bacterium]
RALARLVPRLAREGPDALDDYGCDAAVLAGRLHKAVCREIHRMHAFVRFEAQVDGTWAARVAPAHDVLPFIGAHFARRYPQMRWTIYDTLRGYAIACAPAEPGAPGSAGARGEVRTLVGAAPPAAQAPHEAEQQRRWRAYLEAVNIPARANPRLQRQHVPLRYRPLLSEFRR